MLAGIEATPAHAITNVYALQRRSRVPAAHVQYAVGPGGTLAPLAPTSIPARADLAVTPNGRFAPTRSSFATSTLTARCAARAFDRNTSTAVTPYAQHLAVAPYGSTSR